MQYTPQHLAFQVSIHSRYPYQVPENFAQFGYTYIMRCSITSSTFLAGALLIASLGELNGVGAPGMFDVAQPSSYSSVASSHLSEFFGVDLSFESCLARS